MVITLLIQLKQIQKPHNIQIKDSQAISSNGTDVNINKAAESSTEDEATVLRKRLLITIIESKKTDQDRFLLDSLIRGLLENRGDDDVEMEVKTTNHVVKLEWPLIKVKATSELAEYIAEMLGDSGYAALVTA